MNLDLLAAVTVGAAFPALLASLWTFFKALRMRREAQEYAQKLQQAADLARNVGRERVSLSTQELERVLSELRSAQTEIGDVADSLQREQAARSNPPSKPANA